MQLHYNILWIDNDISEYIERGQIKKLESYLSELGFIPYINPIEDDNDIDKALIETKFDLIISDYQLDNTTGDKVIEHIRQEKFMTEILFYSSRINFKKDPEIKETLAFLDRVSFHFGRDNLLDKIEQLISLTLDKLLELNATRGLITAATSELDVTLEDITLHILNEYFSDSSEKKETIIKDHITYLEESAEEFQKKYNNIGFENSFKGFTAFKKWRIFRGLLKELSRTSLNQTSISAFLKENSTYQQEVIEIRNKFAHAKEENVDGKKYLKGQHNKADFQFDSDACIKIRKDIIQHKLNFDVLLLTFNLS